MRNFKITVSDTGVIMYVSRIYFFVENYAFSLHFSECFAMSDG